MKTDLTSKEELTIQVFGIMGQIFYWFWIVIIII
jgi:hypothetical protein